MAEKSGNDENVNTEQHVFFSVYTPEHDFNLDEILKEVAYFRGTASFTSQYCFQDNSIDCPKASSLLRNFTSMIRAPCEELFFKCSWNDVIFDCCQRFLPIQTEFGQCFSINSLHTTETHQKYFPLISNANLGLGSLKLELNAPAEVHWHSRADVPYFNKLSSESLVAPRGTLKRRSLSLRETVNEPDVRLIKPRMRRCRYADETNDQTDDGGLQLAQYDLYSYSVCVVECRQRAALRLCNCTTHMMPPLYGDFDTICDLEGLNCLNNKYERLTVLKGRWSTEGEVRCECLPECNEPEISLVVSEDVRGEEGLSKVEVVLDRLPGERYKRVVVRSNLDLVVSMGGAAGLFVGASLLSAVELVYFFSVRLCCALQHHATKRREKKRKAKLRLTSNSGEELISWWTKHRL